MHEKPFCLTASCILFCSILLNLYKHLPFSPDDMDQERDWLYVDQDTFQSCPDGIKRTLSYVTDLRAFWRRQRHAESVASSHWMVSLMMPRSSAVHLSRSHGLSRTKIGASDGSTLHDVISQILDFSSTESNSIFLISRVFARVPGCILRRELHSRSKIQSLYFALAHCPFNNMDHRVRDASPLHLIFGMKGPAHGHHQSSAQEKLSTLMPILEDLACHAQPHLARLVALAKSHSASLRDFIPKWLVLFGLVCDAEYLHIVAHVPYLREEGILGFVSFLVDSLPLCASLPHEGNATHEAIPGQSSAVVALMMLRRHASRLSGFLSSDTFVTLWRELSDDGRHTDPSVFSTCHSSAGPKITNSERSSRYSTCPTRISMDRSCVGTGTSASKRRCQDRQWDGTSFTPSSIVSSCSSCSGSSGDPSPPHSEYSQYTSGKFEESGYMKPSTSCLSEGEAGGTSPYRHFREARRSEIVAWALQVVPCRAPEDDTYRMVVDLEDRLRDDEES